MTRLFQSPRCDVVSGAYSELARKADICATVLAEARRLSQAGIFGAPLNHLLIRAGELLDDMDEILVARDPGRNGVDFAIAANLHRELEFIQAAVADRRRDDASSSTAASAR